MNVLVVGASRGVGRGFVSTLRARGDRVFAASRTLAPGPDVFQLDVTDEPSVVAAAAQLARQGVSLDLLLVTSGMLHEPGHSPEKSLRQVNPERMLRSFAVNTLGPLLVAKHFLPLMVKTRPRFVVLSARVGSVADNRLGGWYGYRASKAALNMSVRNIAIELERRGGGGVAMLLHPGTVATELSEPFADPRHHKVFTVDEAVGHLLPLIDAATATESGRFFAWDGAEIPW
jgi:NAD(P)-dependent dehydrogenase (short-subunit alcohol dehydrogenase family)